MENIAPLPFHELINIMDIVFTSILHAIHSLNLSALSVFRLFYTVPMKCTSKNMALIYRVHVFTHLLSNIQSSKYALKTTVLNIIITLG